MSTQRPNVVIMISHDTGRFVSPYGYTTVNTPNFERLAQMSTTFDNCFCTTPLCAPARAALLTGLYPHQNGMMGLPSDTLGDWDMVRKDRHIAAVLKSHGYRTVLCGFEHESQDLFSIGFEEAIHGSGKGHNGGKTITGAGKDINNWFEANPGAGKEYPFTCKSDAHRLTGNGTGMPSLMMEKVYGRLLILSMILMWTKKWQNFKEPVTLWIRG